jgi:hypothetical protein
LSSRRRAPLPRALGWTVAALAGALWPGGLAAADAPLVVAVLRDGASFAAARDAPASAALTALPGPVSIASLLPAGSARKVVLRSGEGGVRVLVDGRPLAPGAEIPGRARRVELQAVRAGRAELDLGGRTLSVSALEVRALDGDGREVDPGTSHVSLQRTPPERIGDDPFADTHDPDALRFVVAGAPDDLPGTLTFVSLAAGGPVLDRLSGVPLGAVPCPPGMPAGVACGSTRPVRAVIDDIDRRHPSVADRSIKAELGGALVIGTPRGEPLELLRVGGPRRSEIGPIVRYRARLRIVTVRPRAHGPPPMGGDDAGARRLAADEVRRANALWGACGVSFGPVDELDVRLVDPPPPHLLALGCDHGLPASGGTVRVRIDGREVGARLPPGATPVAAARVVAAAIVAAGFVARVSDNPRIGAGTFPTSDVLVRRAGGALASIEPPRSGPVSDDATMTACIGAVNLDDGLQHFGDVDAIAGTLEERTLLKGLGDGEPGAIEVVMVPSFGGGGRIGESFIAADGGAVQNVVLLDRAAIRADRASFALAHELGHVLLDDPGHPDDFGVDTPTRLMDADAANGTAYGPRRLLVSECVRAIRQSGPTSRAPLLRPWPLAPVGSDDATPVAHGGSRRAR